MNLLKIDVAFQKWVLIINLLLFAGGFIAGWFWVYMMLLQFLVGIYQICISGLGHLLSKTSTNDIQSYRKFHFFFSIVYVGVLILFFEFSDNVLGLFVWFVLPQLIAYAYYFLSWKDYSSRKNYINQRPTIFS